jgi:hypothetical protein
VSRCVCNTVGTDITAPRITGNDRHGKEAGDRRPRWRRPFWLRRRAGLGSCSESRVAFSAGYAIRRPWSRQVELAAGDLLPPRVQTITVCGYKLLK